VDKLQVEQSVPRFASQVTIRGEELKPLSYGDTREMAIGHIHTTLYRVCKAEPEKQDVIPEVHVAQRNINTGS
jgi:hypothetical protein